MSSDTKRIVYLEGDDRPIDYTDFLYSITYEPIWSDGRLDGTFIPKQIGVFPNPPEGKISLFDGRVISFSAVDEKSDNVLIIKQPYYVIEWTRRIEP